MKTHFALLTLVLASPAFAAAPATMKVFPAEIELRGKEDRQTFVVQAIDSQGISRDVTVAAKARLAARMPAWMAWNSRGARSEGSPTRARRVTCTG